MKGFCRDSEGLAGFFKRLGVADLVFCGPGPRNFLPWLG